MRATILATALAATTFLTTSAPLTQAVAQGCDAKCQQLKQWPNTQRHKQLKAILKKHFPPKQKQKKRK